MKFRSILSRSAAYLGTASAVVFTSLAHAEGGGSGVDYSTLTDAVDFSTIGPGVLGVAAALVGVYVIIKGVRIMVGFVRGG